MCRLSFNFAINLSASSVKVQSRRVFTLLLHGGNERSWTVQNFLEIVIATRYAAMQLSLDQKSVFSTSPQKRPFLWHVHVSVLLRYILFLTVFVFRLSME